jgi:ribosome-associated protein
MAGPDIKINPSLAIDDSQFVERFVRSSGPGGQNVNKVATAVELRFDIAASSLPDDVKARLTTIAHNHINTDGVLIIDSRAFRSQARNREAARARLAAVIRQAAVRPRKRRPTRPGKAAREQRLNAKKQRGQLKSERRGRPDRE